ncbi:hypothetical protein Tco_1312210 [Tanacetum coccineum]
MDNTDPPPEKEIDSDVMLIELIKDNEHPSDDELNEDVDVGEEEFEGNHFYRFPTCGFSVKNALAIQRCELSRKELDEFLSFYLIPSQYRVILPTPTQTILDAPPRYIGLYTHFFSFANLRLPLNDFFCEVLQYFKVYISRINPFGCSKLTTFNVMCKAYDCEPSVELFRGFFNLCKAGSWLTFQKRSKKHIPSLLAKVITRIKEMSFRNFIYTEDDEDLTFLPKDFSPGFNIGSPYVSINTEPVRADEKPTVEPATEPVNERVKTTADSGGSPKGDTFVVHARSVAARIRERKCKIRGGSSTSRTVRAKASIIKDDAPVLSISDDDEGLEDCLELKDATACHLKISAITPPVNRRSYELLKVIEKLSGEADVMQARELSREEECEGLRAKCEAAMTDLDKNPTVLLLRKKISSLVAEAKEHKGNLDRLMLESQKWSGYQVSLSALESKVASLEAEKANLEATKASLHQEVEEVKHDRREVASKVVPYACMELLHSDELGRLVGKLVSSAITFGRCRAYEQVARMKDPFDLSKVKGYRPSYEKEHTQASNDLATATFSWLNEYVADASASMEALLSKKPPLYRSLLLRGPICMCLLPS